MAEKSVYRELAPSELYYARCHDHGNMNITVALTIHTRSPLDLGVVKVGLQEIQHHHPELTSRIVRKGGKEYFKSMECPVLPLDADFQCKDMIHQRFNTATGPLWKVQILTCDDLEKANLAFGPEVEAIIEDDSSLETRWRYMLRYMQGSLNRDIENFENESKEEEGRSIILITFHPAVTDVTGALYLAKQFMSILDIKLGEDEGPVSLGQPEHFPRSIESVLPANDSFFHLGDILPMVKAVGSQFIHLRRSPFEDLLVPSDSHNGNEPRSRFLRGWLNETETRELLALCEEEDVSLHGIVQAAALTAMSRLCSSSSSFTSQEVNHVLKAAIAVNLRQFCSQAQRYGCFSSQYEENFTVPTVIDSSDLWMFAHTLTMAHNTAKANRAAIRQVRTLSNLHATSGLETLFKEQPHGTRRIDNDLTIAVHGDLGHIFRRESDTESAEQQVRMEDVMLMVSAQNMGSLVNHSAHIYKGRLNYVLGYYTNYLDTAHVLQLRDETINLLRFAVER